MDQYLAGDVVLGNLEGTLTTGGASKCGAGSSNCYAFRTPPSYARWLKDAGFTVMNLANNHAYDYGPSAERDTVAALTRVGLRNTGRPGTQATQTAGGQQVALLGFASVHVVRPAHGHRAGAAPGARRPPRTAQIVVVMFHGGAEGSDKTHVPQGTETFLGENRGDLRRFTHAVIDAGADLVVGSGPHVMRGMELYKGRLVAYSMGNFAGYAVFSLGGVLSTSGVLQVTLNPDGSSAAAASGPPSSWARAPPRRAATASPWSSRSRARTSGRARRASARTASSAPGPRRLAVRLRGLDHVVLTVRDVDRTVAFYESLGATEVEFGEGRRALEVGAQRINLHVAGAEIAPHARAPAPGTGDLCLLLDGSVDEALAGLSAAGIPVEVGPVERTGAAGPLRSVYVRDPDGNLVELAEVRPG